MCGLPLLDASGYRVVWNIGSYDRICSYNAPFTDTDVWQNRAHHPDKSSVSNLNEAVIVNNL